MKANKGTDEDRKYQHMCWSHAAVALKRARGSKGKRISSPNMDKTVKTMLEKPFRKLLWYKEHTIQELNLFAAKKCRKITLWKCELLDPVFCWQVSVSVGTPLTASLTHRATKGKHSPADFKQWVMCMWSPESICSKTSASRRQVGCHKSPGQTCLSAEWSGFWSKFLF